MNPGLYPTPNRNYSNGGKGGHSAAGHYDTKTDSLKSGLNAAAPEFVPSQNKQTVPPQEKSLNPNAREFVPGQVFSPILNYQQRHRQQNPGYHNNNSPDYSKKPNTQSYVPYAPNYYESNNTKPAFSRTHIIQSKIEKVDMKAEVVMKEQNAEHKEEIVNREHTEKSDKLNKEIVKEEELEKKEVETTNDVKVNTSEEDKKNLTENLHESVPSIDSKNTTEDTIQVEENKSSEPENHEPNEPIKSVDTENTEQTLKEKSDNNTIQEGSTTDNDSAGISEEPAESIQDRTNSDSESGNTTSSEDPNHDDEKTEIDILSISESDHTERINDLQSSKEEELDQSSDKKPHRIQKDIVYDQSYNPSNCTGKKMYSKNFLLQFKSHYTEKPVNMAELPDVTLNTSSRETPEFKSRTPKLEKRRITPADRNARTGETPRKNRKQVKVTRKPVLKQQNNNNDTEIQVTYKIQALLNKLAPNTYEKLLKQFKEIDISKDDHLQIMINLIFRKAVSEPRYCEIYAKLCSDFVNTAKASNLAKIFRQHLLSCCQKGLKKRKLFLLFHLIYLKLRKWKQKKMS